MLFEKSFQDLTGNFPFPWQESLYQRFVGETLGGFPTSCNIPTGLGKTSVVAIWLLALAKLPNVIPRRLVYVVNRRTVVDQTSEEVTGYNKRWLKSNNIDLAISSLRGQYVDNQQWSGDPSRPAVICGTVDMIGSRLLFSGYGIGHKARPLHAGFLGQDALIVHDEAHLEPAFQELLEAILEEQREGRFKDRHPIRVLELTATSRGNGICFGLTENEKNEDSCNPNASIQLQTVWKRNHAIKHLKLVEQKDNKVGEQIARLAIDTFRDSSSSVLIFTRTIDDVKKITEILEKEKLKYALLIGPMRGLERERLVGNEHQLSNPIFERFLPKSKLGQNVVKPTEPVFLVCTSAGEVGVNISADHLVCDLSTFESMAQRFGRVNRFGECQNSEIHIVYPAKFTEKKPDPQREKTLELMRSIVKNHGAIASPHVLSQLDQRARADAFSPKPEILPTSDILFDSWSLTSIRERLPGRPMVEPYLHGIREWEPPETTVAWREEVGVVVGDLCKTYPPIDLLEEYPLQSHELLRDRTDRVWSELAKIANRFPDKPVWLADENGDIEFDLKMRDLTELAMKDKKAIEEKLALKKVLLPHDIGGLNEKGLLDGEFLRIAEDGACVSNDVSDAKTVGDSVNRQRLRFWDGNESPPEKLSNYRRVLQIKVSSNEEEEDSPSRTWNWVELPVFRESSKQSVLPVLWQSHTEDVVKRAQEITDKLDLQEDIKIAIVLAAKFHDLGKRRIKWQQSIGRPKRHEDKWFAKSGQKWVANDRLKYRHEFGSLIDLAKEAEFNSLSDTSKDLVLHLVATHHGQARPHFASDQTIDPNASTADRERTAAEVPVRFARLQRIYGRWGLAYYESILRAADWHASAAPSAFYYEDAK